MLLPLLSLLPFAPVRLAQPPTHALRRKGGGGGERRRQRGLCGVCCLALSQRLRDPLQRRAALTTGAGEAGRATTDSQVAAGCDRRLCWSLNATVGRLQVDQGAWMGPEMPSLGQVTGTPKPFSSPGPHRQFRHAGRQRRRATLRALRQGAGRAACTGAAARRCVLGQAARLPSPPPCAWVHSSCAGPAHATRRRRGCGGGRAAAGGGGTGAGGALAPAVSSKGGSGCGAVCQLQGWCAAGACAA